MSFIRQPRPTPISVKLAYGLLILACGIVIAKLVVDLRAERNGDIAAATSRATGASASTEQHVVDPNVEKRIHELLMGGEPEGEVSQDLASEPTGEGMVALKPISPIEAASPAKPMKPVVLANINPIRQQTPLHQQMITPGNFEYLGAFRPPLVHDLKSKFSYGGWAIAYREGGDPNGPDDGFPGSLFFVGHRNDELVAEIDIPRPNISGRKSLDDLSVCKVLQPFADITGGIRAKMTNGSSEPFLIGGLQVLGDRLHWTIHKYYNVEGYDYYSHGSASLTLQRPDAQGPWHLGPFNTDAPQWHSYKNAGYVFDIPEPIATKYFGGNNLISGLQISTGLQQSSQGPSFYAYKAPYPAPPSGTDLNAVPMLWYPMSAQLAGHHYADKWTGAAWVTVGNKHSIVVVGRKAHGEVYYGMPRPNDCYEDKGYHGSSYEAQILFYTPNQLIQGSQQSVPNTPPAIRWDSNTAGGGIDRFMFRECKKEIGGVAYDRTRNLLYIVEAAAGYAEENPWELLPIVHIMRLVAE